MTRRYWCPSALLKDGWRDSVEVVVDADGWIVSTRPGASRGDNALLKGPVIPGMPNLHSHAHQRAMAGMAERASSNGDSFWTWRETMYHYVNRISPDQLEAIARQLYVEMLKTGYTSVAEFQYLHHDPSGARYENPAHMTLRCLHAACETGIGFTALPVLYQHGGFGSLAAGEGQRRFINDVVAFLAIVERLFEAAGSDTNLAVGIAPHSLRAVNAESLAALLDACGERVAAIHIHIAEQLREVEECLAWSGQRPVEWLLNHFDVDSRWCLVHATHMNPMETRALAISGAVAGLCPTTEASLGDGLFNAREYLAANGSWGIGSDSQISVSPVEELRWLEYGIRLASGTRNALATATMPNTGQAMLEAALKGGARACGRPTGVIAPGYRADLVVLDGEHPRLYGRRDATLIDSWIFSGNDNVVRDVFVGGRQVIESGHHRLEEAIAHDFRRALDQLNP